jgi:hypothetical protein
MRAAHGIVPFAFLILAACGGASAASDTAPLSKAPRHEQITVKVRNGKTGLPIWLASPYVYVGNVDANHMAEAQRKTTFWNDAHVDVTGANPRNVTVVLDFIQRDCR